MMTVKIELRVDAEVESEKGETIITAGKMAAKHLFTTAALLSGNRKPQIVLECGDMFIPDREIQLVDDIET